MRKLLMVMLLSLVFSFLTVIPASCNDTLINEDLQMGVLPRNIWNQKRSFNIEQVNVIDGKIEVIIIEMTSRSETEIREIAMPFEVAFINQKRNGRDAYKRPVNYILTEGKTDVSCEGEECGGLIFQLQNAPYVSGGFLMIPLKEVLTMLDNSSDRHYDLKWVGGDNQMIEITTNSNVWLIPISCKNNTKKIVPFDDTSVLEGKIEIRNGVVYFPCSKENLRHIVPSIKIKQDFEEMNIEIFT